MLVIVMDVASEIIVETYREQLSRIPSLHQLLSTDQRVVDNQLLNKETDDPLVPHLVRYSELVSHDLESKPINEKMDHWYLDMKKNLMVTSSVRIFSLPSLVFSLVSNRMNSINYVYSFSKKLNKSLYEKNKRKCVQFIISVDDSSI